MDRKDMGRIMQVVISEDGFFMETTNGQMVRLLPIVHPEDIHPNAREHGWLHSGHLRLAQEDNGVVPELLCLIHSEVSEALEGYRNHVEEGQKGCLSEELADIIIRVFHMAAMYGIDIGEAVMKKHLYNMAREVRHGGKKC